MRCPLLVVILVAAQAGCTWDWSRFGASSDADQSNDEDRSDWICVQAESGNLTDPMSIVEDETAEGGRAITCHGTESDCRDTGATAVFRIGIDTTGVYRVRARVWALNAGDDSFLFSIDEAEPDAWSWNPGIESSWYGIWQYDDVNLVGDWDINGGPEFDPALFDLDGGVHIFRFEARESEGLLDSFCVVPHL